jgi:hypothetical protein
MAREAEQTMNEETVLFPLKDSGCKRQTPKLALFRRTWGSNQFPLGINATCFRSLPSTDRISLFLKAVGYVANNIVKPAEVDREEKPSNSNVERTRTGGYS